MNTFANREMKRRLHILVELAVIVLLSVALPKEISHNHSEAAPVQIVRVEIEEEEEVERYDRDSESQSDSIENDGGKKIKPIVAFNQTKQINRISERVNEHNYTLGKHFYPKSPRYILYCSLIVYS